MDIVSMTDNADQVFVVCSPSFETKVFSFHIEKKRLSLSAVRSMAEEKFQQVFPDQTLPNGAMKLVNPTDSTILTPIVSDAELLTRVETMPLNERGDPLPLRVRFFAAEDVDQ